MGKSLQLYAIITIIYIKILNVHSTGNFYTSDQKNVYYIDNEDKYSWFDSLTKCTMLNMSLPTINTREKSNEITKLLSKTFKHVNPLWIGGIYDAKAHKYLWISTGDTVTFTNWAPGEPNFLGNIEYCLQTGWTEKIQWNDCPCNVLYGLICEYNDQSRKQSKELKEFYEKKLQKELLKEKQLQRQLDRNQYFLQMLLDYRICNDRGNKSIHDEFLNII